MAANNNIHSHNDTIPIVRNKTEIMSSESKILQGNREKIYGAVFLSAVTAVSTLIGFGTALATVRKKDPKYFHEGVIGGKNVADSGATLAMKALGWGTVYAVTGCGILFYGIWKWSGATNAREFREKMGSILPRIPKNNPPQSRTEFDGLNDFMKYVSEEWGKDNEKDNK